jgi:hypothetical protein
VVKSEKSERRLHRWPRGASNAPPFMHEGETMVIIRISARSVLDLQNIIAGVREREMKGSSLGPRPSRVRVYRVVSPPMSPALANHVIYQLPIGGLLDSCARTTMPVMRTPKEAGEVSC